MSEECRGQKLFTKMAEVLESEHCTIIDIRVAITGLLLACIINEHNQSGTLKDLEMPRSFIDTMKSSILNRLSKEGWS